ncbi:MAG TPA: glycosyltransferase family 4 protein [Verrucomicrobiae bacterium]|nr:glycosyltransferase family 4 protein [Verrucomicrobiae bacterium]
MRVGLIVPEFPPDTIGGGGEVFEGLALGLAKRGHLVKVVTSSTWGGPAPLDDRYPFPVLRVPEFKHFTEQFRTYMPPLPQYIPAARRFLRDCDVVNLHGYGMAFIDALFLCAVRKRTAIFTTHGFPYTAPLARGLLSKAYLVYDRAIGRRILRESAAVTAVSSLLARETEAVAHRPVEVIGNGFTDFAPAQPLPGLLAEASRGSYILCVGRLEPLKGFDQAIQVVARLRDRGTSLRLLLAGSDNGAQKSLRDLARSLDVTDNISFVGRVPRDQLAWLYERAAAVLVPSVTESFSLVTLEAMSRGGACVVAAVGGMLDFAQDQKNCLLYPFGELESIVQAITRLLTDPGLNGQLRVGARSTPDRFSWDRIVTQYEAAYERVREAGSVPLGRP